MVPQNSSKAARNTASLWALVERVTRAVIVDADADAEATACGASLASADIREIVHSLPRAKMLAVYRRLFDERYSQSYVLGIWKRVYRYNKTLKAKDVQALVVEKPDDDAAAAGCGAKSRKSDGRLLFKASEHKQMLRLVELYVLGSVEPALLDGHNR